MYSTYIQRIEIALLSDPWCIQLTRTGKDGKGVQLPDSLMDEAVLRSAEG